MNQILLIAHAPLAQALRQCALHVFPDSAEHVLALDVPPDAPPEDTMAEAARLIASAGATGRDTLLLTDVIGATPCNVAHRLVEHLQATGVQARVRGVSGVNVPMLLRAVCYRDEPIDVTHERALAGGSEGVATIDCLP